MQKNVHEILLRDSYDARFVYKDPCLWKLFFFKFWLYFNPLLFCTNISNTLYPSSARPSHQSPFNGTKGLNGQHRKRKIGTLSLKDST